MSVSDLAIYPLSRKVIARQMAKITWPREASYTSGTPKTGANTLCGLCEAYTTMQVAQVINDFAVPTKGLISSSVGQNL